MLNDGNEAATTTGRYLVKCDDCKAPIRETDDVRESYAGGTCAGCRHCGATDQASHTGFCATRDGEFRKDRTTILDRDGSCACCGEPTLRGGSCIIDCEIEIVTETNVPFLSCGDHGELPTKGARSIKLDRLSGRPVLGR